MNNKIKQKASTVLKSSEHPSSQHKQHQSDDVPQKIVVLPDHSKTVRSITAQSASHGLRFSWYQKLLGLLLLCLTGPVWSADEVDLPFDPGVIVNLNSGSVHAQAIQSDGKIIFVGDFTRVGGMVRNRIARLNSDGTLDANFKPNVNATIDAIVIQSDGKILIAGFFTTVDGMLQKSIARLNTDGTLDTGFNPTLAGFPSLDVKAIAIQPADGKILIGGGFTEVDGTARNHIARLNTDGTLDMDFDPNANNTISSIAIQSDDKILLGGFFTMVGGETRLRIARLNVDGTLDMDFSPDVNNTIQSIVIQPADSKILIGGQFTQVGVIRNRIARLNTDGTVDMSFDPNANGNVNTIAIQSDGKILIGGDFSFVGVLPRSRLARLNATGTVDTGFNPGANNTVYAIAIQLDGMVEKILIGGRFKSVGGIARHKLGRLITDGTVDVLLIDAQIGIRGVVNAVAIQSDGKILVAGDFASIGVIIRNRIARFNPDGTLDMGFNPNANGTVNTIAIQADNQILIGGEFTGAGGESRSRIARLNVDGTADTTFNNPNANNGVNTLAIQSDGKILVGGLFINVGGISRNRIARLNADGTLDMGFDPNANNTVFSIAIQSDGKILLGGFFTTVSGMTRNRIARLNSDGTLDMGFNPDANRGIYAVAVQSDGKILIGGDFLLVGGMGRSRIAQLNTDGTVDTAFNPAPNNIVFTIALQSEGQILIGGAFTAVGGMNRRGIARLNINGTVDMGYDPGADDRVLSIAIQLDDKVLVGGRFSEVGNVSRFGLARLLKNAPGLAISATNGTQSEGDNGQTSFTFTVDRSSSADAVASVDYAVTGSGANPANADDFGGSLPSGTVNFAISDTSETITIPVSGDMAIEMDEGFTVTLSNPVPATIPITSATAEGVIEDDDDNDGDGVANNSDNCPDTANPGQENFDSDLLGDVCDPDDDNDGMTDQYEVDNGLNPMLDDSGLDKDGDGLTNLEEFTLDLDADDPDTDEDGIQDDIDPNPGVSDNFCTGTDPVVENQMFASPAVLCGKWFSDGRRHGTDVDGWGILR